MFWLGWGNEMNFSRDYLKQLARIPTSKWEKGIANDERDEQCYDYCQLRNAAKDLLDNQNDKESKKELSKLVKKLKIDIK